MARRSTAQDVADLAGVSRSAVSLVLNGRADGNISAANQRAVVEAAQQLDYRPNALALSLRNRRTGTLGVLTWPGPLGFPQPLLHAAWDAAASAGYLLMLMDTAGRPDHEQDVVATLLDRQVDGFLVVAPELVTYRPPEAMAGTPTILVNCVDPDHRVTSIVPDEFGAAQGAAEILIEQGHRRIALLTDQTDTVQAHDRAAGVEAALLGAGLPPPVLLEAGGEVRLGVQRVSEALSQPDGPTGLVCVHERLGLAAVLAAAELRLDIPGELSVVSLEDGENLAAQLVPALTTVQRPDRAMAAEAVALLLRQLAGEPEDVRQLSFVCPTDLRDSTGPAPVRA